MGRVGRSSGFTLAEMMVTVTLVGILTAVGVPSFQSIYQRRHLEGAAGELVLNLLLMRSEAIEKNRTVYVDFSGGGKNWLYGLDDTAPCAPDTGGDCTVNQGERVYRGSVWKTVTMVQPFVGNQLSFDPRRGVPSGSGTIQLTSAAGEIDVTVSPIGVISACSPQRLGGYASC